MLQIRDLHNMDKVSTEWIEGFETYIPKWLDSLIPHYELGKEYGVDVVALCNVMYFGDKPEEIERNGVHYYLIDTPTLGKTLEFNGNRGYYPCNWEDGFDLELKYPPVDKYGIPKNFDWLYTHNHLWRWLNRKTPYNELSKRIEKLFQQITNDDSVLFDFGSTSYILFDHKRRAYLDNKLEA